MQRIENHPEIYDGNHSKTMAKLTRVFGLENFTFADVTTKPLRVQKLV